MRGGRHGPGDRDRTRLREDRLIGGEGNRKREIALKLGIIARQMRKAFDSDVGAMGVTRSQWTLIIVVSRNPGATQRSIAEALEMTEAAAGRLIDRLCGEGLLERRAKPDDRRAHCVYLTPRAEPLLDRLSEFGQRNEERAFAGFSDSELARLAGLLQRVQLNIVGADDCDA